jgi:hypothetical protein
VNEDEYRFDIGGAPIGTAGVVDEELSRPGEEGVWGEPEPETAWEEDEVRLIGIG